MDVQKLESLLFGGHNLTGRKAFNQNYRAMGKEYSVKRWFGTPSNIL